MGSAKDPFKKSAKYFRTKLIFWMYLVALLCVAQTHRCPCRLENILRKSVRKDHTECPLLGFQHAARRDLGALAVWQIEAHLLDKETNKHNNIIITHKQMSQTVLGPTTPRRQLTASVRGDVKLPHCLATHTNNLGFRV